MFAANGQNLFHFTGPTTLGATEIDVLTWIDEINFLNTCNEFVTVSVKDDVVDQMDALGENMRGPWDVTLNADQTMGTLCKHESTTACLEFATPPCP